MSKTTHTAGSTVLRLTLSAMLVAVSIVLCRLLGYSPGDSFIRVEFGIIPIAVIAMLYGPLWSAVGYALADLIGSLIFTGMNPLILLCKAASGLLLGVFLYTKRPRMQMGECAVRSVLCYLTVAALIDGAAMSPILMWMGLAPDNAVGWGLRFLNIAINLVIRIALTLALYAPLGRHIAKYKTKGVVHL